MKRFLFLIFHLFFLFHAYSQSDSNLVVNWNEGIKLKIDPNSSWDVNTLKHIIISNNDRIYKYDTIGKLLFQASTKSLGKIAQIDARNPMKTMVFSQQQQLISYLDNTLTSQQTEIELMNLDVSFGTVVCTSNQPDKFWVYDQDNSKLLLLGTQKQLQNQTIENINGLLGINQFDQIQEINEYLFCADYTHGVYQFDRYGTLIDRWEMNSFQYFEIVNDHLYILKNNTFLVINLKNSSTTEIKINTQETIHDFRIRNTTFYFRSKENIWITNVDLSKN